MTEPNPAEKTTSLTEFVTRNDKVLAAIGVFVALSAFFISLPLKSLSSLLALASLVATFPLIYEFARDLLRTKSSWPLLFFSNVFTLFIGYFVWYVLIAFREQWWSQMHKIVFWTIFLGLLALYRRFLRRHYQRAFGYLAFHAEHFRTAVFGRIVRLQLALWSQLHLWQESFIFGRSRFSALRWKVLHDRKVAAANVDSDAKYEDQRTQRWRSPEHANELQILGTIILFIPVWFAVGQLQNPVADIVNTALDIQAEEYQREEKLQRIRIIDTNAIPAPAEKPEKPAGE